MKSSLCCTACDHVKLVLTSLLFVVVSALSAPAVELFRYRYHAEDGREFECVFETDEQSVPKTVGEEKATEIAMDWMRVFYHVQVGTIGPLPGPNPHRLSPAICVTVDPPDGSGTKSLHSRVSHR